MSSKDEQLYVAAGNHQWDKVSALLNKGVSPRTYDSGGGWTALHLMSRNTDLSKIFRNSDVSINSLVEVNSDWSAADQVDVSDDCGWTPLHVAAQCGHIGNVRWLLEQGASRDVLTFRLTFLS